MGERAKSWLTPSSGREAEMVEHMPTLGITHSSIVEHGSTIRGENGNNSKALISATATQVGLSHWLIAAVCSPRITGTYLKDKEVRVGELSSPGENISKASRPKHGAAGTDGVALRARARKRIFETLAIEPSEPSGARSRCSSLSISNCAAPSAPGFGIIWGRLGRRPTSSRFRIVPNIRTAW
jgi:hypothetical protein